MGKVDPNEMEVIDPVVVSPEKKVIQMSPDMSEGPAQGTPQYIPGKEYTWDPDATFTLSGKEFGLWLNSTQSKLNTKEAFEVRMALESHNVIERLMIQGVASGVIREVSQQPKE